VKTIAPDTVEKMTIGCKDQALIKGTKTKDNQSPSTNTVIKNPEEWIPAIRTTVSQSDLNQIQGITTTVGTSIIEVRIANQIHLGGTAQLNTSAAAAAAEASRCNLVGLMKETTRHLLIDKLGRNLRNRNDLTQILNPLKSHSGAGLTKTRSRNLL
jgi:hypothetical protein